MNFGFILYYLAALFLLAMAGFWWSWQNGPAVQPSYLSWVLPLAALLICASASCHLLLRARAWTRQNRERLERSSAQLEESRQTYQALLDHSDLFICTLDGRGRYLSMNRYGLDMLGASLQEIEGKYFEEHLDQAGAARMRGMLQTALEKGQSARNLEPLFMGGRQRFMDVHMKSLAAARVNKPRVLLLMRDQTEQKVFEEHMWHTEKLASLGLLAAGVAHQINNPLGILMGFGQLLKDGANEDFKGYRELGIILEQGAECKRIVDGLLNFTRLAELGGGKCDLLTGLHAVLDTVRPVLKSKGIELALDLPASLPGCRAQDSSLQQVFLNLISNAMDAMPQGGMLNISASHRQKEPLQGSMHGTLPDSQNYVEMIFQDSGPGIPPEDLERIYDPFFTTKPVGQGTGLGLSVAYGILREYGGTITAVQNAPNACQETAGACFVIRLPVPADGPPRKAPAVSG